MGGGLVEITKFKRELTNGQDILPYLEFADVPKEDIIELRHIPEVHEVLEEMFPEHDLDDEYDYYVLTEEGIDTLISSINSYLAQDEEELVDVKKVNQLLECLEELGTDFDFDGDEVLTISWGQ